MLDTDPHAAAIGWPGPSVRSITEPVDLGPFEDAEQCRVSFLRRHAADGKRLHALDPDPQTAHVVRRIFAEYLAGRGLKAIAEGLTRDDIPSPSAYDPARNKHRCGIAWSWCAVGAILANPRYTGRQVWNKQPKSEVLIDVNDVALGHTTKQPWNEPGKWIWSEQARP